MHSAYSAWRRDTALLRAATANTLLPRWVPFGSPGMSNTSMVASAKGKSSMSFRRQPTAVFSSSRGTDGASSDSNWYSPPASTVVQWRAAACTSLPSFSSTSAGAGRAAAW